MRGSTKEKNPPSNLSDIFTTALASLALKAENFSSADGTSSLQLKKREFSKENNVKK
jgi:hypothetical protein